MAMPLAILALAACTTTDGTTGHAAHHPDRAARAPAQGDATTMGGMSGGQSGAATMSGAPSGQMAPGQTNMGAMCPMHRDMQKMSPEQHRAMMDEKMKGMTPEMRQHHMEMMRRHCQ
ncbi:hypothetical protein [Massilia niabensis]|uniref:Lipoprotein n=1 Tax=Massilia niabensis TaxID=544910 RepID=A0ABW0LE76_9BURK